MQKRHPQNSTFIYNLKKNFQKVDIEVSGWFISLPQFLSHHNKNLECWNKGFKTTDEIQLSSAQANIFY